MPFVPLRQTVIVVKSDGLDDWGRPVEGGRVEYKARVQEATKVKGASGSENSVFSVKAEAGGDRVKIYFDGLVDIVLNDRVEYTDELGRVFVYEPSEIVVKRWLSGKVMFTLVYA